MTDELVKRHVEQLRLTGGDLADLCQPIANAIEALTAERDTAKAKVEQLGREVNMAKYGQPDFAWSVHLEVMAELQAERDAAYARGYSDAETEISKSALGQSNDFLHSQYANAKPRIEDLQAQIMRLSGMVHDLKKEVAISDALLIGEAEASLERLARAEVAEAERDRLREALTMIDAIDPEHHIDGCAQAVVRGLVLRMGETAREALKGESHE